MSKNEDKLTAIRQEVENLSKKLAELADEELEQVTGGSTGRGTVATGRIETGTIVVSGD